MRPWLAMAGVLALAGALLLYETRDLIFFYDEWSFLLGRRANDADAFLLPHNEHPSLVPVLVWKAWWTLFGTSHYLPYRLLIIAVHLTSCALLFALARPRVGPWLALVPATLLAFLGPAFEDLLWPFQISFIGPVTCWLAILLALDRRRDLLASVLLGVALFCSGSGAPVAAGTAVALLLSDGGVRRAVRVLAVPVTLYVAWFAAYGVRGSFRAGNVLATPGVVLDSAAACLAALVGLPWRLGYPLALALTALLVWMGVRWLRSPAGRGAVNVARTPGAWRAALQRGVAGPREPLPAAGLLAALATALAFWGLQGLFRGALDPPPPSHYLYPGAVFMAVVIVELAGLRPLRVRPAAGVAIALLCAAAVVTNVATLREGARGMQATSEVLRAQLGALELVRGQVPGDFQPDPALAPQVSAGPYFAAIDRTGSIADAPETIATRSEPARQAADVTMLRASRVRLQPAAAESCRRVPGELAVPPGGLVLRVAGAPATVLLRRFGAGYARPGTAPAAAAFAGLADTRSWPLLTAPAFRLTPDAAARLSPPGTGWRARVEGPASVCLSAR